VPDDTIRLENAVFTGLAAGALAPGAFNTGAAASQADDRIIYNTATGALLFDADGSGAGAAVHFATLAGGLALTASDFLVI
jgi:serralysin